MLKITRLNLISLVIWLSVTPLFLLATSAAEKDKFEELSSQLSEAIDARNFQAARTTMEEMMPLMKEILKENKKELSELKKGDSSEEDVQLFEKKLTRKTELYESFKKLVDVSPAALRGKSQMIKDGVTEFVELI